MQHYNVSSLSVYIIFYFFIFLFASQKILTHKLFFTHIRSINYNYRKGRLYGV